MDKEDFLLSCLSANRATYNRVMWQARFTLQHPQSLLVRWDDDELLVTEALEPIPRRILLPFAIVVTGVIELILLASLLDQWSWRERGDAGVASYFIALLILIPLFTGWLLTLLQDSVRSPLMIRVREDELRVERGFRGYWFHARQIAAILTRESDDHQSVLYLRTRCGFSYTLLRLRDHVECEEVAALLRNALGISRGRHSSKAATREGIRT